MIVGGSECGKTNALLNLTSHQLDIDKMYQYAHFPYESKHQLLIKKPKDAGIKHCNDAKAFMEYSITMNDVYNNINDYNPNRNF